MHANYFIGLSSILMILVFILPVIYWRKKTKLPLRYFWYGALTWLLAISVKLLMDISITPRLVPFGLVVMSIFVGLRTGLLESGFSYLYAKKKIEEINFKNAIAFGIGMGGVESLFLGVISLTVFLLIVFNPGVFSSLDESVYKQLVASYSGSSLIAVAAVAERILALIIHLAATILVFVSLKNRNLKFLVFSIIYKSFLDGILPFLTRTFAVDTLTGVYLIEVPILVLALLGLYLIRKNKVKLEK